MLYSQQELGFLRLGIWSSLTCSVLPVNWYARFMQFVNIILHAGAKFCCLAPIPCRLAGETARAVGNHRISKYFFDLKALIWGQMLRTNQWIAASASYCDRAGSGLLHTSTRAVICPRGQYICTRHSVSYHLYSRVHIWLYMCIYGCRQRQPGAFSRPVWLPARSL